VIRRLVAAWLLVVVPPAAAQTFSDSGPDAEEFGKSAFYPVDQARFRDVRFLVGNLSRFDQLPRTRTVSRGEGPVRELKRGQLTSDLRYAYQGRQRTLYDYLDRHPVTGLLLGQDDTILFEHYQYARTDKDRFLSQSMAKTVTAMLVGIAVGDGLIASIDDPVATYVPELADKEYGRTPIRALLHMASGMKYTEDYSGSDDHAKLSRGLLEVQPEGHARLIGQFNQRAAPPNTEFHYASIETEILGLVLSRVLKQPVAEFLSERIWRKIGAEADAKWGYDAGGLERGYCCLNATLRDYARLARLLAFDGAWDGQPLIPRQWVIDATSVPADKPFLAPRAGRNGYGYQVWLVHGDRRQFALLGIHGQIILVDPAAKLFLVHTAVRKKPSNNPEANEIYALWREFVARYGS
jgi:CubicO group peptidase (beta-lactamase class C family)